MQASISLLVSYMAAASCGLFPLRHFVYAVEYAAHSHQFRRTSEYGHLPRASLASKQRRSGERERDPHHLKIPPADAHSAYAILR